MTTGKKSRSRRRTKKEETQIKEEVPEKTKKVKKRKKREVNVDAWFDKHLDSIVSMSGLDLLNLTREEYAEILRDIIASIYGSRSSYTKVEVVVKRLRRFEKQLYPLIALKLAQLKDKFTEEQLEFIVTNIGDAVLGLAFKLYKNLKDVGREDLIDLLRNKWFNAWIKNKYKTPLPPCPKCGFYALTPDLTCLVCGSSVSEREFKNGYSFLNKLREEVEVAECNELLEALRKGYVLVNGYGIKLGTRMREAVDVEVYLSRSEIELIKSELKKRCEGRLSGGS